MTEIDKILDSYCKEVWEICDKGLMRRKLKLLAKKAIQDGMDLIDPESISGMNPKKINEKYGVKFWVK